MYDQAASELIEALSRRREVKDGELVFHVTEKCLETAQAEDRINDLLKDFPALYEIVITFDRFFQSESKP